MDQKFNWNCYSSKNMCESLPWPKKVSFHLFDSVVNTEYLSVYRYLSGGIYSLYVRKFNVSHHPTIYSKLQYFGYLMWRTDSLEKTLMLRKIEEGGEGDNRGWDGWVASSTWWTWVWVGSRSWWWTRKPGVLQSMGSQRIRHDWVTEVNWLNNGF